MGRSDRTDPDGIKEGTLLTDKDASDQETLERALKMKDVDLFLVHRGCRDSLKDLASLLCRGDLSKLEIQQALKDHNSGKVRHEWRHKIHEQRVRSRAHEAKQQGERD